MQGCQLQKSYIYLVIRHTYQYNDRKKFISSLMNPRMIFTKPENDGKIILISFVNNILGFTRLLMNFLWSLFG
jgi:hypothetical protein